MLFLLGYTLIIDITNKKLKIINSIIYKSNIYTSYYFIFTCNVIVNNNILLYIHLYNMKFCHGIIFNDTLIK